MVFPLTYIKDVSGTKVIASDLKFKIIKLNFIYKLINHNINHQGTQRGTENRENNRFVFG